MARGRDPGHNGMERRPRCWTTRGRCAHERAKKGGIALATQVRCRAARRRPVVLSRATQRGFKGAAIALRRSRLEARLASSSRDGGSRGLAARASCGMWSSAALAGARAAASSLAAAAAARRPLRGVGLQGCERRRPPAPPSGVAKCTCAARVRPPRTRGEQPSATTTTTRTSRHARAQRDHRYRGFCVALDRRSATAAPRRAARRALGGAQLVEGDVCDLPAAASVHGELESSGLAGTCSSALSF